MPHQLSRILTIIAARQGTVFVISGLIVALAHGSTLSEWWHGDDFELMYTGFHYSRLEYFYEREPSQVISPAVFAPWLPFIMGTDLRLFGLNALYFRVHYLFDFALLGAATFYLVRHWLTAAWAWTSVLLFMFGSVTLEMAVRLDERHYIDGLLFNTIAVLSFLDYLRTRRWASLLFGLLFYFLAISAKEIYFPLPFILLLFPVSTLRIRAHACLPYFIMAVLYVLWRGYMLGTPVGGYPYAPHMSVIDWLAVPKVIAVSLFGPSYAQVGGCLLFASFMLLAITSAHLPLLLAGAAAVFVPLIFVAFLIPTSSRFLIAVWWAAALVLATSMSIVAQKHRMSSILCLMVTSFFISISYREANRVAGNNRENNAREELEGRWILESKPGAVLLVQRLTWPLSQVLRIRKDLGDGLTPVVLADEIELPEDIPASRHFLEFDSSCLCLADVTGTISSRRIVWRERVREAPLKAEMNYANNQFTWRLGPYSQGRYWLIVPSLRVKVQFPKEGVRSVHWTKPLTFLIRYDDQSGWTTYSNELTLDVPGTLVWDR